MKKHLWKEEKQPVLTETTFPFSTRRPGIESGRRMKEKGGQKEHHTISEN